MLSKLLKYDFKALKRILVPVLLCVLGMALIGSISLTVSLRVNSENFILVNMISSLITSFMVLGIIASFMVIGVVILFNFYKSFVSNEAYLTFTLPVSIKDHMLSKMISGYVWMILSAVVIGISGFLIAFVGTAESGLFNADAFFAMIDAISYYFGDWTFKYTVALIQIILMVLIYPMTVLLQYYTAIIIGGVVAKKNKLLAAIGFVFLFNFVVGFVYQIVELIAFASLDLFTETDILGAMLSRMQIIFTVLIILFLALAAGYYFFSKHLLENKLNLE